MSSSPLATPRSPSPAPLAGPRAAGADAAQAGFAARRAAQTGSPNATTGQDTLAARSPAQPTARPAFQGPLPPKRPHAHRHEHGHAHGGMTTFIMDIDEIMAFTAPRVAQGLLTPANAATRLGARGLNLAMGPNTVTAAQASRAGAALAATGGLATVGGGIYYAWVAMHEAYEGRGHAEAQRKAWTRTLRGQPAAGAAGTRPLAEVLEARAVPATTTARLVAAGENALLQSRLAAIGKGFATVGAAAMAATLLFSPEFLLAAVVPAVAGLSPIAMAIAIPTMAMYGVLSAVGAAASCWRGWRTLGALKDHLKTLPEAERTALQPHVDRYSKGLKYEAIMGVGGLALAAGLVLQLVSGLAGLALLAVGTFALEGFAFLRNSTQGSFGPEALTAAGPDAPVRQTPAALLAKMEALREAESALTSLRPSSAAGLRSLYLTVRREQSAEALKARLVKTLAALRPVHAQFGAVPSDADYAQLAAQDARPSDTCRLVLTLLHDMDLLAPFSQRFGQSKAGQAMFAADAPHVDAEDDQAAKDACYATLLRRLEVGDGAPEARAADFYREALETLWTEGCGRVLNAYGEARTVYVERVLAERA